MTLEGIGHVQLGEHAASEQQTGGISGSVVGQPDLHSILGKLVRVGSSENVISLDLGVGNLQKVSRRNCGERYNLYQSTVMKTINSILKPNMRLANISPGQ